jgi:hypothetical protein
LGSKHGDMNLSYPYPNQSPFSFSLPPFKHRIFFFSHSFHPNIGLDLTPASISDSKLSNGAINRCWLLTKKIEVTMHALKYVMNVWIPNILLEKERNLSLQHNGEVTTVCQLMDQHHDQ